MSISANNGRYSSLGYTCTCTYKYNTYFGPVPAIWMSKISILQKFYELAQHYIHFCWFVLSQHCFEFLPSLQESYVMSHSCSGTVMVSGWTQILVLWYAGFCIRRWKFIAVPNWSIVNTPLHENSHRNYTRNLA